MSKALFRFFVCFLISLFSLAYGNLHGQGRAVHEVGIHFGRIVPSSFTPTPDYDAMDFPYMSGYQRNGRSFEIQLEYRRNVIKNWGIHLGLGASFYTTGLSVYLPEDEDPYAAGDGTYDFYNSLVGSRMSASFGIDFALNAKWFEVRPCIGIILGSHLNEVLRLSQGYATNVPVGSSTYKPVFQVYLERKRLLEINPFGGSYLCIDELSDLINFVLGVQYVYGDRESLFGYYQVDAASGQYIGTLSSTEERLEFLVGINLKINRKN